MILTAHLLTGAAIASKVSNPAGAIILAFLSHYFLDLLPQIEYSVKSIRERRWQKSFQDFFKVALDFFSGILLILLFSNNQPIIFVAALVAIVPDGLHFLNIVFYKNRLLKKHQDLIDIEKGIEEYLPVD